MRALGINIVKDEIWFCALEGSKHAPIYFSHERSRFDSTSTKTLMANSFKQIFSEEMNRFSPDVVGYRVSLDAKRLDQIGYLLFPYGILNLIAFEKGVESRAFVTNSFSKKALNFDGCKFEACDQLISNRPNRWGRNDKLAALSAWMCLDE